MANPTDLEKLKRDLIDDKVQLFDVREPDEWAAGHLKQASLVPLSTLTAGEEPDFDKSKKTLVHCRSGGRVLKAAPLLEKMGFREVSAMPEGFEALVIAGFEKA